MVADSAALRAQVRRLLDHGLMLDPWLAGLDRERFSFDGQELLAQTAAGLQRVRVERRRDEGVFADLERAACFFARSEPRVHRVLEAIPWAARGELLAERVARGREVMARTDLAQRTVPFPSECVSGEVPAGGRQVGS